MCSVLFESESVELGSKCALNSRDMIGRRTRQRQSQSWSPASRIENRVALLWVLVSRYTPYSANRIQIINRCRWRRVYATATAPAPCPALPALPAGQDSKLAAHILMHSTSRVKVNQKPKRKSLMLVNILYLVIYHRRFIGAAP